MVQLGEEICFVISGCNPLYASPCFPVTTIAFEVGSDGNLREKATCPIHSFKLRFICTDQNMTIRQT